MDSSDDSVKLPAAEDEQLPKQSVFENLDLQLWEGYWYRPHHLQAAKAAQSLFNARDDDIILASPMKTGTTWLKALCYSILHRHHDPLAKNHPAAYVQTLEVQVYTTNPPPDLSVLPSPRLFHTHLPYSALPASIKNSTSCKIVYIARNPKDTLVSMWHFFNTLRTAQQQVPYPLIKAFDSFCNGVCHFGPFFDHVLEYWNENLKMPDKVLFLKYEDLQRDPKVEVKRLASFLGRPVNDANELGKIVWMCSFDRLKNLDVNKNGVDPWVRMPNSAFFRLGVVGDWKRNLTLEMSERLDQITKTKLEWSGLHL